MHDNDENVVNESQASVPQHPNQPNNAVAAGLSAAEIQINFDESQDGKRGFQQNTNINEHALAYSADNFLLRNEAIEFHKKEKAYKSRI